MRYGMKLYNKLRSPLGEGLRPRRYSPHPAATMTAGLRFFPLLVVLFACTTTACNLVPVSLPRETPAVRLLVHLDKEYYCINEDILVQVSLTNSGKTGVFIDGHWALLPILMPPRMSSGALLISDSSGQAITVSIRIDRIPVQEEDFVILVPGQTINKTVVLHNKLHGDPDNYYRYAFISMEKYTVTAIYQNELAFSKMIEGKEITAWTGKVSGYDVFQIKSKDCEN